MKNLYENISDAELKLIAKLVRSRVSWYNRNRIGIGQPFRVMASELEMKLLDELDRRLPAGWEQDWGNSTFGPDDK